MARVTTPITGWREPAGVATVASLYEVYVAMGADGLYRIDDDPTNEAAFVLDPQNGSPLRLDDAGPSNVMLVQGGTSPVKTISL